MITIPAPRELLERLHSAFLSGDAVEFEKGLARQHSCLPIHGDFMGWWGINMAGMLIFIPDDDPSVWEPVLGRDAEKPQVHLSFALAARRHPALAPFLPPKPTDAVACIHCDGTGALPGMPSNVVCACGGTGWLPREVAEALDREP